MISADYCKAKNFTPLAKFRRVVGSDQAKIYISNQLVGDFSELVCSVQKVEDDYIKVQLNSNNIGILVIIEGLSMEDIQMLQSIELADQSETLRQYLMGEENVLSSSDATLTPHHFAILCENRNHGIVKSICLLQVSTCNHMEDLYQQHQRSLNTIKDQIKIIKEQQDRILGCKERCEAISVTDEKDEKDKQERLKIVEEQLTSVISKRKKVEESLRVCTIESPVFEQYILPSQFNDMHINNIQSQADTLRDLCVSVLNRSSDLEMLKTNRTIKKENTNLKDIHVRISTVQISHEGRSFNISPEFGYQFDGIDETEMWRLPIHDCIIDANEVHTLNMSLSGVPYRKINGRMSTIPNNPLAVQLEIMFYGGCSLQG